MPNLSSKNKSPNSIWKYAGLTTQFFAGIGGMMYLGWWIDKWLAIKTPIVIWILPLLFIIGMIIRIIVDNKKTPKN